MSERDSIVIAERSIEALASHDAAQLRALRGPGYMLEHPAHRSGTTPRIEDGRGVRSPVCFDRFGMVKELRQIISW